MTKTAYDPTGNSVRSLEETAAWQGVDTEEVIDRDRLIVDPHHHLGRNKRGLYLPADYLADASGHRIAATVFIECRTAYRTDGPEEFRCLGETEYVVDAVASSPAAERNNICAGIVGHADLQLGDRVKPVLQAQIEAAKGRLRGIRYQLRWDASGIGLFGRNDPPHLALDASFRKGFAHLAPLGLAFDAWAFHPQLSEIADLARAFPETTIVVNHVGGPLGVGEYAGRRDEVFALWRAGIAELSHCPNVLMKVGGLGMLYYGFTFHAQDSAPSSVALAKAWAPYINECLDRFGPERCMFESNYPVDKQSCSYRTLWNAFKRITADLSEADKEALFSKTAARAYRLEGPLAAAAAR